MSDIVMRHENINGPIAEGDYVRKYRGARFEGEVTKIFPTLGGETRCIVEAIIPEFAGTCHIFAVEQLVRAPCPKRRVTEQDARD